MVIFAQDEHPSLNEVDDNITVEYEKGLPADRSAFMVINSDLSTRKDVKFAIIIIIIKNFKFRCVVTDY